jgi:hypothetical protein
MLKSHCTLEYHHFGTTKLDTFASGVANGIYTNPTSFPAPIIAQPAFGGLRTAFSTAAAEYATYGATKKTALINAQKALIDGLDLQADYVNTVANGDESLIILAGFVPSITVPQSNIPVEVINSFSVKRTNNIGEIIVEIPAITGHGSINYICVCVEANPLTTPLITNGQLKTEAADGLVRIDVNKSRKKIFTGLTPGVIYYFYVTASNTAGVGPLSALRSLMAA